MSGEKPICAQRNGHPGRRTEVVCADVGIGGHTASKDSPDPGLSFYFDQKKLYLRLAKQDSAAGSVP